ncbi:hypothetical protein H70357_04860 [Paenibacillus sp. FSL H7-0357]|jgi:hypothetical protein|nr:hypothetical protein H70357_04860 [Paenibacillus sp. FSL H7-0357]
MLDICQQAEETFLGKGWSLLFYLFIDSTAYQLFPVSETVKLVEVFRNLPEGAPVTVLLLKTELPLAELLTYTP